MHSPTHLGFDLSRWVPFYLLEQVHKLTEVELPLAACYQSNLLNNNSAVLSQLTEVPFRVITRTPSSCHIKLDGATCGNDSSRR